MSYVIPAQSTTTGPKALTKGACSNDTELRRYGLVLSFCGLDDPSASSAASEDGRAGGCAPH